jgi:hypothetical protein
LHVEAELLREPGEQLPAQVVAETRKGPGRPPTKYRVVVASEEDVAACRARHVPVDLLTAEWVTQAGYPTEFRPWLAVHESLASRVDSPYRMMKVRDPETLREHGVEQLLTLLLRYDKLAARVVAWRNRRVLKPAELYRHVKNEHLEVEAARVRLFEFSRDLPRIGSPLPAADLAAVQRNNPAPAGWSVPRAMPLPSFRRRGRSWIVTRLNYG